jgi:hypothetical protein
MKVELLRLDLANGHHPFLRVSRRFETIVNLAREITWQRDTCGPRRHHEWQQLTMTIKELSWAHLSLVHVIHAYASADTLWVAHALSSLSPMSYDRVSVNSATDEASTQLKACSFGPNRCGPWSAQGGGGYHLGAPNFVSDHSSFFPSSILHFPLIALPGLILNHSINYLSSPHSNLKPGYRKP